MKRMLVYLNGYQKESVIAPLFKMLEACFDLLVPLVMADIETHVADARTCCLNPASSTHRQMNDEQLKAAGVPAELVRMSCGLENKQDLIDDIAQALDQVK